MTIRSRHRRVVRSGLIDQRDRATKRRRKYAVPTQSKVDLFDTLGDLAREFLAELGISHSGSMPIERYLRFVGMPDVPISERLRLLAITIEELGYPWPVVDQVYQQALRHPADIVVLESRAISAHRCGFVDSRARQSEFSIVTTGAFLYPEDPAWDYRLGIYCYDHGNDPAASVAHFQRAVDRGLRDGLTMLYLARSLHDLGRWEDAIDAYDSVPLDDLDSASRSWRIHFLVEERATCLYFSGRCDEARVEFERIIGRYETQPHLAVRGESFLPLAARKFPDLADRIDRILR